MHPNKQLAGHRLSLTTWKVTMARIGQVRTAKLCATLMHCASPQPHNNQQTQVSISNAPPTSHQKQRQRSCHSAAEQPSRKGCTVEPAAGRSQHQRRALVQGQMLHRQAYRYQPSHQVTWRSGKGYAHRNMQTSRRLDSNLQGPCTQDGALQGIAYKRQGQHCR